MGLITCAKCKKIYDYDKYNGICPKCARYNRETSAAAEHQDYHNKYDGGYSHTAQDDHHSYHQRYDNNKAPHVKLTVGEEKNNSSMDTANKTAKLILGLIIAVIIISTAPFTGFLSVPIAIGVAAYVANKKKK